MRFPTSIGIRLFRHQYTGFSSNSIGVAFIKSQKISRADILLDLVRKGTCPGVETPLTPGVVDEIDAGDVVEGVGVGGLRRVGWWFVDAGQ